MKDFKLSPLDLAIIKINRLELEAERYEIRLAALRCKITELISEKPQIIVVKDG